MAGPLRFRSALLAVCFCLVGCSGSEVVADGDATTAPPSSITPCTDPSLPTDIGGTPSRSDGEVAISEAARRLFLNGERIGHEVERIVGARMGMRWLNEDNTKMFVSVVNLSAEDAAAFAAAMPEWSRAVVFVPAQYSWAEVEAYRARAAEALAGADEVAVGIRIDGGFGATARPTISVAADAVAPETLRRLRSVVPSDLLHTSIGPGCAPQRT
jgi:hypothetical protein